MNVPSQYNNNLVLYRELHTITCILKNLLIEIQRSVIEPTYLFALGGFFASSTIYSILASSLPLIH